MAPTTIVGVVCFLALVLLAPRLFGIVMVLCAVLAAPLVFIVGEAGAQEETTTTTTTEATTTTTKPPRCHEHDAAVASYTVADCGTVGSALGQYLTTGSFPEDFAGYDVLTAIQTGPASIPATECSMSYGFALIFAVVQSNGNDDDVHHLRAGRRHQRS